MAKIYRTTDKIKYKIGEIEISISPLSVHDKAVLHAYLIKAQNGDAKSLLEGSAQAIKCAVKSVSGLEDSDLAINTNLSLKKAEITTSLTNV
jgi:hypothetical protein